tara:strand:- start:538 stop:1020 length:483 start_codon:yes stop_codon:yes gene_type:complete
MNCDYESQINDYLDNKLKDTDKINFENYLSENLEFRKVVDEIKNNDLLLKKLPELETDSSFILNLNHKIDLYEKNKFSFNKLNVINQLFNKESRNQLLGAFSVIIILTFTLYKMSDLNLLSNFNNFSDKDNNELPIAVNDTDSLNSIINDTPILLIGNEK